MQNVELSCVQGAPFAHKADHRAAQGCSGQNKLMRQLCGSAVTSDSRLLAFRELRTTLSRGDRVAAPHCHARAGKAECSGNRAVCLGEGVSLVSPLADVVAALAGGSICLSEDAYRQVKGRLDLAVHDLGPIELKNIAEPIRVSIR